MQIDISNPMAAMVKQSPKGFGRIRRLIERHGYRAEISTKGSDFDDFYRNMYEPYIARRFDDSVIVLDRARMREMFASAELLLLKKDKSTVAGGLVCYRGIDAHFAFFGVRGGDFEHVRRGAMGACYFFIIRHLKKKGFRTLKIGGVSPFLNDGRFLYKARLLARIDHDFTYARDKFMLMKLLNDSPGSRDFLVDQPFVFQAENQRLFSAHWVMEDGPEAKKKFSRNVALSERVGLRGCRIFAFDDAVFSKSRFAAPVPGKTEVRPAGPLFRHINAEA